MVWHLLRMTRRRAGPVAGACVLLTGGVGACVLLGGSAQAAACPGTPVVAGTACTDTGTLTFTGGSLNLLSPIALTWAGNGLDQQLVDATTAHQSYVVDDATGSGAGWNVTVSATTFTNGTVSLANTGTFSTNGSITSAVATTAPTGACTSGATCTVPTDTSVYPVAMTTAATTPTAYKIYDTSAATGPLILVDAQMPGLDGFALVEWLLKQADLRHTTVMMLTSSGHSGDVARCRELGIAAYLTKPIMQAQLLDAVRAALGTKAAADKPCPAAGPAPRQTNPGLRVLLAEDNAVNQKLASRLLERRGHTVAVATNGRQALEMLDTQGFDLVVMDVSMPEMDGFEAAAAIRAREESTGAHIPILAMTAHAMKGDREKCLGAGMDGYVAKPVQAAQLFAAIDSVTAARP